MMRRLRPHVTFANVCAFLALVIALGTGGAYAANTVFSTDIVNGEVKAPDLAANAVVTGKVANESLTGADIDNQSGVDTCTHGTTRFREFCLRGLNQLNTWSDAVNACADLSLRLPTYSEARMLAVQRNIPGVEDTEYFWTDGAWTDGGNVWAWSVNENGIDSSRFISDEIKTLCVTTPTN